ncbi:hypothetical protein [Streptomyces sp. NPDC048508]|uniref:hypothetical protein n=1 Tax=Streptomyces sp. NPDC048508 TaxID=3365561 RepID=UPI003717F284
MKVQAEQAVSTTTFQHEIEKKLSIFLESSADFNSGDAKRNAQVLLRTLAQIRHMKPRKNPVSRVLQCGVSEVISRELAVASEEAVASVWLPYALQELDHGNVDQGSVRLWTYAAVQAIRGILILVDTEALPTGVDPFLYAEAVHEIVKQITRTSTKK